MVKVNYLKYAQISVNHLGITILIKYHSFYIVANFYKIRNEMKTIPINKHDARTISKI